VPPSNPEENLKMQDPTIKASGFNEAAAMTPRNDAAEDAEALRRGHRRLSGFNEAF
jgi:hypothetical protein